MRLREVEPDADARSSDRSRASRSARCSGTAIGDASSNTKTTGDIPAGTSREVLVEHLRDRDRPIAALVHILEVGLIARDGPRVERVLVAADHVILEHRNAPLRGSARQLPGARRRDRRRDARAGASAASDRGCRCRALPRWPTRIAAGSKRRRARVATRFGDPFPTCGVTRRWSDSAPVAVKPRRDAASGRKPASAAAVP